jgi:SAM-dependent methyltransferase
VFSSYTIDCGAHNIALQWSNTGEAVRTSSVNQYIDGTYLEKVREWHAGDSPWKASKVLRMLGSHHLSPKSVCDVGCGAGKILVEMQRKMPQEVVFCGYDISPQAISIARPQENSKLHFFNEDILFTETRPFDLLLLLDVFEHVADYIGFLEALRKKASWFIFHIPLDFSVGSAKRKSATILKMREQYGHLHYFTKETALATLADTGYQVVDYFYTDDLEMAEKPPKGLRPRLGYEARKLMFRRNPDLAAFIFASYNLLVLARGDPSTS